MTEAGRIAARMSRGGPNSPRPFVPPVGDAEMTACYDAACERLGDLVAEIAGERSEVAGLLTEIRAIEAERLRLFDAAVYGGDAR